MKYSIYQLKKNQEGMALLHLKYDDAKNKLNPSNYEKVWEGETDANGVNDIIAELNKQLPKGFYGHTPDVSDIIVLEDGSVHYIDCVGTKILTSFNLPL